MKLKPYVYVGEPIPDFSKQEYVNFRLHLEKSAILSLEKRSLLNHSQAQRAIKELETLHSKECSKHRA